MTLLLAILAMFLYALQRDTGFDTVVAWGVGTVLFAFAFRVLYGLASWLGGTETE